MKSRPKINWINLADILNRGSVYRSILLWIKTDKPLPRQVDTMNIRNLLSLSVLTLALTLTSCRQPATPSPIPSPEPQTQPTPGPSGEETTISQAIIDTVEVLILESFPVQVNVDVRGIFPDSCTELEDIQVDRNGDRFNILITTRRPVGGGCEEEEIPFEETLALDVYGLPAGQYQIDVNGVTNEFSLALDNIPATEPPPVEAGTGTLSGRVWHDLCGVSGGEGGEQAVPTAGCIETSDGYQANGVLDANEPGLEGIILNLGSGPCPSVGILTTLTGTNGEYEFTDLQTGTYCGSIDTGNRVNEPILVPGAWPVPTTDQIIVEQVPDAGAATEVNFGWDYQFLPESEPATGCTDRVSFVGDVTYPDNSIVSAGETFEKIWRLKNDGTCTWSPDYALVYAKGEQMGGPEIARLEGDIHPGGTLDLTVSLSAPSEDGTYQGFWQLQDPSGKRFGIGSEADQPFWVLIQVESTPIGSDLGKPDWQDSFTDGSNWPLFEDDHGSFAIDDGSLRMTAKNPDWWASWMLTRQTLENFQLEIEATFAECAGFDHYGVIFRAPDAEEGLLFTLSCDGRYALRKWDGVTMELLTGWTASKAIRAGASQTNRLRVKAEGSTLTLYINDQELETISEDSSLEGRFGLVIGAAETEDFSVTVDEISLWELN